MSDPEANEPVAEHQEEEAAAAPAPPDGAEEEEPVVDPEAAAAAAVAVSYQATLDQNAATAAAAAAAAVSSSPAAVLAANTSNKWSKNGFGVSVNKQTGKFSKEESETVRSAIEEYCNAKQISVARLCSECDHKAELKGAWMEIAKRLPHRSVQSVYRHGIRQCHPFKRGAWSEPECITLTELVTSLGKKWSAIQAKLNRSADSCRDKYREMSDEYVKGRWKEEETEALQKLIRDHLNQATGGATAGVTDMKELGKMVEDQGIQIPWSEISKRMGKRSRLSCFKKWQKMTGLFSASDESRGGGKHALGGEDGGGGGDAEEGPQQQQQPDAKRAKTGEEEGKAAAAEPVPQHDTSHAVAELAAETVEALGLPEVATTQSV